MVTKIQFFTVVFAVIGVMSGQQANAHFSQQYLHAFDQMMKGVFSSAFRDDAEENTAQRRLLSSHLSNTYHTLMSTTNADDLRVVSFSSIDCLSDLMTIVTSIRSSAAPEWSLRFADAFFKPPAGLFDGNLNWLGAFDECSKIKVDDGVNSMNGKFCLVPLYMSNITTFLKSAIPGSTEALNLGFCLPSSCGPEDISSLVNMANNKIRSSSLMNASVFTRSDKMRCHNPDLPLSSYFYIAIIVVVCIVTLNVLSTIYDVVLRYIGCSDVVDYQQLTSGNAVGTPNSQAVSPISHRTPSGLVVDSGSEPSSANRSAERPSLIKKPPSMVVSPIIENTAMTTPLSSSAYMEITNLPAVTCVEHKRSLVSQVLLSFSVIKNAEKLLNTSGPRSALNFSAIHGIRLISLMWVILGHTFLIPMATYDNVMNILDYTRKIGFQVVMNGLLSVDTFFVLSGFLVGYVALRQMDKFQQLLRSQSTSRLSRIARWFGFFGCFYVHRYLRLTPLLAFVLIVYMGISPYLLDGPLWVQATDANCVDHWWTNILYINNLVYRNEECIGWTWYLAVDTQLFAIAPLPLLCFFWRPLLGWLCIFALLVVSAVTNGLISWNKGFTAAPMSGFLTLNRTVFEQQMVAFERDFFADLYILPWCRCAAWAVGLALGCSLSRLPASFSNAKLQSTFTRRMIAIIGWTLSTVAGLVVVYGLWPIYHDDYIIPQWLSSFYWACSRIAWGLVISWVIYVCVSGVYGARPLRSFLAFPGFIPLSRLSYCAYLIHPIVLSCFFLSLRGPFHFTGTAFGFVFCGTLVLTFAISFIITVAVEMPFAALDKLLLPGRMRD